MYPAVRISIECLHGSLSTSIALIRIIVLDTNCSPLSWILCVLISSMYPAGKISIECQYRSLATSVALIGITVLALANQRPQQPLTLAGGEAFTFVSFAPLFPFTSTSTCIDYPQVLEVNSAYLLTNNLHVYRARDISLSLFPLPPPARKHGRASDDLDESHLPPRPLYDVLRDAAKSGLK